MPSERYIKAYHDIYGGMWYVIDAKSGIVVTVKDTQEEADERCDELNAEDTDNAN